MSFFYIRVWVDGSDIVSVRTGQGPITPISDYEGATIIDAVGDGDYVDAGTLLPTLTYQNNVLSSSLVTLYPAKDVTSLFANSGFAGQAVYNWTDDNLYQWQGNPWGASALGRSTVQRIASDEATAVVGSTATFLVTIFKVSVGVPDTPTGGSYNFDSQVLTPPATWSATPPLETGELYISQGLARVVAPAVLDENISWSTPVAFAQDGQSAVSALLTNESHTVAADADGSNPDLTGATTDMRVFLGVDEDTPNWTFARVNSTGISSTISGNTVTVTAMTVDEGYVDITASRDDFADVTKRFTLTKSKAGEDGTSAKLLTLTATGQIFTFNGAGSPDPSSQTITFTAALQNTINSTASWSTSPTVSLGGSGNTRTLSVASFGSNTAVTVTAFADGGAVIDRITVYRVSNGADGVNGGRGPGRWYIDVDGRHDIATSPITEAEARTEWNFASGSNSIPVRPSVYDQVIFYNGTEASPTKQQAFICTSVTSDTVHTWNEQETLIDGDLLVAGTVTADRLQIGDSSLSSDAGGGLLVQGGNITVLRDNFYSAITPIDGGGFSTPPVTADLSLVGGNVVTVPAGFIADLQIVVTFEHGYFNLPGFNDDWGLRVQGAFAGDALEELYARYNPTMTLETDYASVVVIKRSLFKPGGVPANYNVFVYWGGGSSDIRLLRCLTSVFVRFK